MPRSIPRADAKIQAKHPTVNEDMVFQKAQKGCEVSKAAVLELQALHARNADRLDAARASAGAAVDADDFTKAYRRTLKDVPGEFGTAVIFANADERLKDGRTSERYSESVAKGARNLLAAGVPRSKVETLLAKSPYLVGAADDVESAKEIAAMPDEELEEFAAMECASDSDFVEADLSKLPPAPSESEAASESDSDDMAPLEDEELASRFEDAVVATRQVAALENAVTSLYRTCKMTVDEAKRIESSNARWSQEEVSVAIKELVAVLGERWTEAGERTQVYADICYRLKQRGFSRNYFAVAGKVRELRALEQSKEVKPVYATYPEGGRRKKRRSGEGYTRVDSRAPK